VSDDLESRFWGNCTRSLGEELKQITYMSRMGFPLVRTWRSGFNFDAEGRSIIDIGGGPVSVLLKMENLESGTVVDPGEYPNWVESRYSEARIGFVPERGEDLESSEDPFDLALIYNCLQHCDDPAKVIANARVCARELRMFEWVDLPPHEGHPHMLTEAKLNEWAGRPGVVETFTGENECHGRAWYLGPDLRGGAAGAIGAGGRR
jgi:hypothetical protein